MATGSSVLRSQMAPAFLKVYAASGGDLGLLLRRFRLPESAASERDLSISLEDLDAVANEAAARAGDPNLGLHLAIRLPRGSYGLLEYIGRTAPTVRHAGERFLRFSTLLNDLVTFTFERRGDVVVLSQRVDGYPPCVGRQAGEMFAALVVRYLRELSDSDWSPVAVRLAHPAPADTSEHAAYFRAPLAWGAGENAVELPSVLLERAVVSHDPMLFSVLDAQAEALLAALPQKSAVLAKIRAQVRVALDDGQPDLAEVATALHMSPRTLQRRLNDEGTGFTEVVDSVREELARIYMANPKYALGEVAYLLGFSEISAFTRAFKRWTGMTPSRWRDQ